jgi:hypothetical protein
MSVAKIVLGRDGMGPEADDADYEAWVAYVSERIDERCGFEVEVEESRPRDVQNDKITLCGFYVEGSNPTDEVEIVEDAVRVLWQDFCRDDSAWPKRTAAHPTAKERAHVGCACGEVTGEACTWRGPRSETVLVEYMPEQHRSSHDAAGNAGSYPHNGAIRIRVQRDCADRLAHVWDEGEMTTELDPWVSIIG